MQASVGPVRWLRRVGAVVVVGGLSAAAAYGYLLPFAARLFVRLLSGTLSLCLWVAMSVNTGVSVWSMLDSLGRAAIGAVATGEALVVIGGLVVVAAVAGYGLQRVVGSSEEFRL